MVGKSSRSLELIEEILRELQGGRPGYVTSSVRKLELVAELLDDDNLARWCRFHLGHYHYRLPRHDDDADLKGYIEQLTDKMGELKLTISTPEIAARVSGFGGGFHSIKFIEDKLEQFNKEKRGNDGVYYRDNLATTITSVANAAAEHASRLYSTLAFGEIPKRHFDVIRNRVDTLLLDVCPEAIEQFMKAYERLGTENAEDWSLALTACRRVIKAVADAIYPPSQDTLGGRKLGDPQYINRLWAFLDQNLPSSSDKDLAKAHVDYLGSFLQRLNDKASKGVHAKVGYDEAVRSILYTYLTLGDLLEFAPRQVSKKLVGESKVDINAATLQELASVPGVGRDLAKQIIKARVATPFQNTDELQKMKGVGPKTLEKLQEHLVALPPVTPMENGN